jgi:hypothetical protein
LEPRISCRSPSSRFARLRYAQLARDLGGPQAILGQLLMRPRSSVCWPVFTPRAFSHGDALELALAALVGLDGSQFARRTRALPRWRCLPSAPAPVGCRLPRSRGPRWRGRAGNGQDGLVGRRRGCRRHISLRTELSHDMPEVLADRVQVASTRRKDGISELANSCRPSAIDRRRRR